MRLDHLLSRENAVEGIPLDRQFRSVVPTLKTLLSLNLYGFQGLTL